MSYIGGSMYDVETCPECGALMWNGRCENPDCVSTMYPGAPRRDWPRWCGREAWKAP